ncbi:hypothetical protein [Bradyrhizobium sp.]|uniref:hypothetical protein n=1 Tax=Bradyrhizobium sp. TaxID=376 RepID=UPI0025C49BEE|nr:hypothetical protein [Bradyrhizobium sp.]
MKLGLAIGYSGAHLDVPVTLVQRAEELGFLLIEQVLSRAEPRWPKRPKAIATNR